MNAHVNASRFSRRALLKGGALTVGFALAGAARRSAQARKARRRATLDPKQVDAFLAVNADGTVTRLLRQGRSRPGPAHRDAADRRPRSSASASTRSNMIEGDTALTPDQGRTSGSNGIQRGGMQIRQAAATARKALIELAAQRLNVPADDLDRGRWRGAAEGRRRRRDVRRAARRQAVRPQARSQGAAQGSRGLHARRQVAAAARTCRRNAPAATSICRTSRVPDMLHGRVIRPPAIGATLVSVDESSVERSAGREGRADQGFPRRRRRGRMDRGRARRARSRRNGARAAACRRRTSSSTSLRADPFVADETLVNKGERRRALPADAKTLKATYFWPMQSHASIGPSCAVADVRADERDDLDRLAGHAWQSGDLRALPRPAARQGAADLSRRLRLLRHERP